MTIPAYSLRRSHDNRFFVANANNDQWELELPSKAHLLALEHRLHLFLVTGEVDAIGESARERETRIRNEEMRANRKRLAAGKNGFITVVGAFYLGLERGYLISQDMIIRSARAGELKGANKAGKRWLIPRAIFEDWITANRGRLRGVPEDWR